jgi:hypothetical protein
MKALTFAYFLAFKCKRLQEQFLASVQINGNGNDITVLQSGWHNTDFWPKK